MDCDLGTHRCGLQIFLAVSEKSITFAAKDIKQQI